MTNSEIKKPCLNCKRLTDNIYLNGVILCAKCVMQMVIEKKSRIEQHSEIKNCPFCGAEISDHFNDDKSEATHLIGNRACFLTGVILKKDVWNTRTPEPTKAENGLDEDKLWELLNDAKNGKSQALQMIGEMARRMESSRPVTDSISVQEILKVIFEDVMNTEADKAADKIFELLSKKGLLAKTDFATTSITRESELAKEKYFTYRGMRADGEFYIEFKDGWPKKMIPNFKEQLLAILPELTKEYFKKDITHADEMLADIQAMSMEIGHLRTNAIMKQRIEELGK